MKELIEQIARALVDDPGQVEVTEMAGDKALVLELHVAQDDLGKIIGRQGRTAIAIRTILDAASKKMRQRAVLEIIE